MDEPSAVEPVVAQLCCGPRLLFVVGFFVFVVGLFVVVGGLLLVGLFRGGLFVVGRYRCSTRVPDGRGFG